ncbi:SIR2 family protein [Rhodococcus sp. BP-252]|nr:SIR2 family protein [Rhodococcus sp. BP-320]MBY6419138.1 SIR2 family protein [Rhodococcus sp. BP-321]MBY6423982.1 SIR2 family protein [Rhodococcus sp. BP-324]MBY6429307.1 SIR2 family protein [Rhodococcus sp. BP-323]MBY6434268.1 SIR2 family protein [Rhodococcus sp. BP-322]MBY6443164.1 SIR2 family protein [Rhodococcus sp. BP-319]MBY6447962.1 SIR2 family protein [Rhodococcus sp. BP-318]MBY6452866.1 SIR2 family protein [Rhodococcus sp. BP-315]MBY6457467.1 SIR2 family protein [Rhodococcus sp.
MIPTALVDAVRSNKAILFAGAGLSMNLGLPSFSSLIDKLAEDLDFDAELFQLAGDFMTLTEYYSVVNEGRLGPLRSWMDTNWHAESIRIEESAIHRAIVDLEFRSIYTSNYDRWIEKSFDHWNKPYHKIANVADIARSPIDTTQIIKFHGDFDDDDSLVLTESSYFRRMSFESPLDLKLRADVLGNTILYLGYSLSDINLRYLLYRLEQQWSEYGVSKSKPQSFIFLARPNAVQELLLSTRGITPIIAEHDNPKTAAENFLQELLDQARGIGYRD